MSNPLRILGVLDQHLSGPAEITLFGRAALALGCPAAQQNFHNTQKGYKSARVALLKAISGPDS